MINAQRTWHNGEEYETTKCAIWQQMHILNGHDPIAYPNGIGRPPDRLVDQLWGEPFLEELKGDIWHTADLRPFRRKYFSHNITQGQNLYLVGGKDFLNVTDDRYCPPDYKVAGICDPTKNYGCDTVVWVVMSDGHLLMLPYGAEWPIGSELAPADYVHEKWLKAEKIVKYNSTQIGQLEIPLTVDDEPPSESAQNDTG